MNALHTRLCRYDSDAWRRAVDILSAENHVIDRAATHIWFSFHPLDLHLALKPDLIVDVGSTTQTYRPRIRRARKLHETLLLGAAIQLGVR